MNNEELNRGKELYDKMVKTRYGTVYYKTAQKRYTEFKDKISKKYNTTLDDVHNQILSSRKTDRLTSF